ncbi:MULTISPECIES: glycosyltransferase [unclassified Yoonia]|uniref:glycosyltransferase n=1 Tax=unclassified Yoonia TaxID=2629118 RepID=UPI002B000EC9|nr:MULTISPECIES: glycosyltransferase [unclassified Yoonia]
MKILHVSPSFYPATFWGGPIWSTKAICDGIADDPGFTLRVLTSDAAGPAVGDRLRRVPLPYRVTYARRIAGHSVAPGLLAHLPAAVGWADLVHLTGTYSFPTLPTLALARALGKPVVWSPRGALQATQDWPDAPRKTVKHLFERAAQCLRPARSILHVTAAMEAAQSVTRLPGIATAIIPNCVAIPQQSARLFRPAGALRLICLGRLHPKKGIDRLIAALAALPDNVTLDLYGGGEAVHVAALQAQAAPFGARIRFHGPVQGAAKARAFAGADLFVLPSHSENFGLVVAEALAHGLPVLTTSATPWAQLDHIGCGRCVDLAEVDLAAAIMDLAAGDLARMGAKGRAWMVRDFSPAAMVAGFAALYRSLGAGPLPMMAPVP